MVLLVGVRRSPATFLFFVKVSIITLIISILISVTILMADSLIGSRPNIILVMTDDQGMGDLSCLGNPVLRTPNLDRFYGLSTRFTDFHVSPTCAPTRAALLSGRHEFRNGVTHTVKEREIMAASTTTIADLLSGNGYETGIFGKWHLGDEDAYQPYNRGFTETFIHGAGGIGQAFPGSCADFPPNKENRYFDNVILHNDTIVQTKGFCTDIFFKAALGWIKDKADADIPFYAYITPNAPHGPMIAPESYTKRFLDLGYDKNTAGRYGMIENIDDNFGLLMEKLEHWDLWENALVIFMTDNGQAGRAATLNGEHVTLFTAGFKTGKGSPYEGGTHVPAFWRWKGRLGEGVDIPALTAHIDIFRTFASLSGTAIPDSIQKLDGRNLLPLLEDPEADWDNRYLFTHKGRWEKGVEPNTHKWQDFSVRTERWRFVNNEELYDISKDPYEKVNVAESHPKVVDRLRTVYDEWWQETRHQMVHEDKLYMEERPQWVRYEKQKLNRGIPDWEEPEI